VRIYLDGTQLAEREPSNVFQDLADTPGVEIRTKRDHGAPMHLKSYQIDGRIMCTGAATTCVSAQRWKASSSKDIPSSAPKHFDNACSRRQRFERARSAPAIQPNTYAASWRWVRCGRERVMMTEWLIIPWFYARLGAWLAWVGWYFIAGGANILWRTFHQ
jgi:hypothetical protein